MLWIGSLVQDENASTEIFSEWRVEAVNISNRKRLPVYLCKALCGGNHVWNMTGLISDV